jgi:hypothetical protein
MRSGRPIAPLSLLAEERETLERWARRPKTAQVELRAPERKSLVLLPQASGLSQNRRRRGRSKNP